MTLIDIQSISKSFGTQKVLQNISLQIKEGQIFGLLGKNGAGKTTLMKLILGLLPADSGEIKVIGEPVQFGYTPTNRHIGYLPDVPAFYVYMTAFEYLCLCGEIAGFSKKERQLRAVKYLEIVGLPKNNKRINGFSRGMKQRLGIAQALIHEPKILICDEPTSALDPIGRKDMLEILQQIKHHTTVIFSTHILNDAQQICDEIAILHEESFVLTGTMTEIMATFEKPRIHVQFHTAEDAQSFQKHFPLAEQQGLTVILQSNYLLELQQKIFKVALAENIFVQAISNEAATLDDIFLEVTAK